MRLVIFRFRIHHKLLIITLIAIINTEIVTVSTEEAFALGRNGGTEEGSVAEDDNEDNEEKIRMLQYGCSSLLRSVLLLSDSLTDILRCLSGLYWSCVGSVSYFVGGAVMVGLVSSGGGGRRERWGEER